MKLKDNKGVTGVDVAISLVIIIIFVSFIAALFYNVSTTSKRIDRKTTATNLAVEVIEAMKSVGCEQLASNTEETELTTENMSTLIFKQIDIPNGYTVKISIEDYNDSGIVKTVTAKVSYLDGKQTETVKIETLIKKTE